MELKLNNLPLLSEVVGLKERVSLKVSEVMTKLPTDLEALDLARGDAYEKRCMEIFKEFETELKAKNSERMVLTRKLDEVKKSFTSEEKAIANELEKLRVFGNRWIKEKLERKRNQEQAIDKTALFFDYERIVNEFHASEIAGYNEYYYSCNEELLLEWRRMNEGYNGSFVQRYAEKFAERVPNYDKELMPRLKEVCERLSQKQLDFIQELCKGVPARIEQLKLMSQEDRAQEYKNILIENDEQKEILAVQSITQALEIIDDKPTIDLGKGVSVKLKYYPTNHTELLKIVQYFLLNEFKNVDFEMLNSRLSFMRTYADRVLNSGTKIDGVPFSEEVSKRKTK